MPELRNSSDYSGALAQSYRRMMLFPRKAYATTSEALNCFEVGHSATPVILAAPLRRACRERDLSGRSEKDRGGARIKVDQAQARPTSLDRRLRKNSAPEPPHAGHSIRCTSVSAKQSSICSDFVTESNSTPILHSYSVAFLVCRRHAPWWELGVRAVLTGPSLKVYRSQPVTWLQRASVMFLLRVVWCQVRLPQHYRPTFWPTSMSPQSAKKVVRPTNDENRQGWA